MTYSGTEPPAGAGREVILVVPCFNEAARWRRGYWDAVMTASNVRILFVDDGSTDETASFLSQECEDPRAEVISLPANGGKAEAVRLGLIEAIAQRPAVVAFLDADGAFPPGEVVRLANMATALPLGDSEDYDALWSSRVMLAGRQISRHSSRHYVGRAVATLIAPWHRYEVYDTQSGFKLFSVSQELRDCLSTPFATRWFPDVELLQRWTRNTGRQMRIWEEPVIGWHDVAGSKVNRSQYGQLLKDLRHVYKGRVAR